MSETPPLSPHPLTTDSLTGETTSGIGNSGNSQIAGITTLNAANPHPSSFPTRNRIPRSVQIGGGSAMLASALMAYLNQNSSLLQLIFDTIPPLQIVPPFYLGIAAGIIAILGILLVVRGLSQQVRPPDSRLLILDPEHNPLHFVGRADDLKALAHNLDVGSLVFLSGESGAGKSALIHVGLPDFLKQHRPDLRLLPVVIDTYSSAENWDSDLATRLSYRLFDALSAAQRTALGMDDRKRTPKQLTEHLRSCEKKTGYVPLLIFDQFDDYQSIFRSNFLSNRAWIAPSELVAQNNLWKAIQTALEDKLIKLLLVTRRDCYESLDSLRFIPPITTPLSRINAPMMRDVLGQIMQGCGLNESQYGELQQCLIRDLADENKEILPAQAALAFQGLASLDYFTVQDYRRKRGVVGLQASHVRRGIMHFANLLRIDETTACRCFRQLVDHGNPPKARVVASTTIALCVSRSEAQVVDALKAVAMPGYRLTRERVPESNNHKSEWSLYHEFWAPIVLDVHRRYDSINAMLINKHAAYQSANTLWARWKSLLSPWETIRLFIGVLRKRVNLTEYWKYCLASTVSFVPLLLIVLISYFAVSEVLVGYKRDVALRIDAVVRAVVDTTAPPAGGELEHLDRLSRSDWSIKEQFVRHQVERPMARQLFVSREKYLTHAILGISPPQTSRLRFLKALGARSLGNARDSHFAQVIWQARILANCEDALHEEKGRNAEELIKLIAEDDDVASVAIARDCFTDLIATLPKYLGTSVSQSVATVLKGTTDVQKELLLIELQMLLNSTSEVQLALIDAHKRVRKLNTGGRRTFFATDLDLLSSPSEPKTVALVAKELVRMISDAPGGVLETGLAKQLEVLVAKSESSFTLELSEAVLNAFEKSDSGSVPELLWSPIIRRLVSRMPRSQRSQFASKLVVAMSKAIDRPRLDMYSELLKMILSDDIEGPAIVIDAIMTVVAETGQLELLKRLGALIVSLPSEAKRPLEELIGTRLIALLRSATTVPDLLPIGEALVVWPGKVDERIAAGIVPQLLDLRNKPSSPRDVAIVIFCIAGMKCELNNDIRQRMREALSAAVDDSKTPFELSSVIIGSSWLKHPVFVESQVKAIERLIDWSGHQEVQELLQVGSERRNVVYSRHSASSSLAVAIRKLGEQFDETASTDLAIRAIRQLRQSDDWQHLCALGMILSNVGQSKQGKLFLEAATAIFDNMPRDSNLMVSSGGAICLSALIERLDSQTASTFIERHTEEIVKKTREANECSYLLSSIFANLRGKTQVAFLRAIIQQMSKSDDNSQRSGLATCLVCPVELEDSDICTKGALLVIDALRASHSDDDVHRLVRGLVTLAPNVPAAATTEAAGVIVQKMTETSDPQMWRVYARCLYDLDKAGAIDDAQLLVDLIKHPLSIVPTVTDESVFFSTGHTGRAYPKTVMHCLLHRLGRGLRDRPFLTLKSFLDWAADHPNANLRLTTPAATLPPPKIPSRMQNLGHFPATARLHSRTDGVSWVARMSMTVRSLPGSHLNVTRRFCGNHSARIGDTQLHRADAVRFVARLKSDAAQKRLYRTLRRVTV